MNRRLSARWQAVFLGRLLKDCTICENDWGNETAMSTLNRFHGCSFDFLFSHSNVFRRTSNAPHIHDRCLLRNYFLMHLCYLPDAWDRHSSWLTPKVTQSVRVLKKKFLGRCFFSLFCFSM